MITISLSISFGIITLLKIQGIKIDETYPSVDCTLMATQYGDTLGKFAYYEYNIIEDPNNPNDAYTGVLPCFCAAEGLLGTSYEYAYEFENSQGWGAVSICYNWYADTTLAYFLTQGAAQVIVIINYVLRLFMMSFIKFIGVTTESEETLYIKNSVFAVQFLNTGILLLIFNANLNESIPMLGGMFNGSYADFTAPWYEDIGNTLVAAMLFNIYWPIIEFFMYWGLRFLFRQMDRGLTSFSLDDTKTNTITLQSYIDIYQGPVYLIHFKYSSVLNIAFVTFMYGIGLPVLFPIALISILVLYICERLCVAYSYKQPPAFDEKLNKSTINMLLWAPLPFFFISFWMMGNK